MSGKPGRSGGARPGAGRKKSEPTPLTVGATDDPLEFLLGVMKDETAAPALRVRSAIAAAQYKHTKLHDGGKKEAAAGKAKKAAAGRFGVRKGPLALVSG